MYLPNKKTPLAIVDSGEKNNSIITVRYTLCENNLSFCLRDLGLPLAPSASAHGGLLQIAIRQQSPSKDTREYYPFGKANA